MGLMETESDEIITQVAAPTVLEALSRTEIDRQIATARAYPRDAKRFVGRAKDLATATLDVADDCIYALPRAGKTIEGPSARFAEIVAHAWGNCRAGARIIDEGKEWLTAQGFFFDLEANSAISFEVKRRITNRDGVRYNSDMISTTANAACSIAFRNVVLHGVPKSFWSPAYEAARLVVAGDSKTLPTRVAQALQYLQKLGASEAMVLETLGVDSVAEITDENLITLKGTAVAIRDGETSIDKAFVPASLVEARRKVRHATKDQKAASSDKPAAVTTDERVAVEEINQGVESGSIADDLALLKAEENRAKEGGARSACLIYMGQLAAANRLPAWAADLTARGAKVRDGLVEPLLGISGVRFSSLNDEQLRTYTQRMMERASGTEGDLSVGAAVESKPVGEARQQEEAAVPTNLMTKLMDVCAKATHRLKVETLKEAPKGSGSWWFMHPPTLADIGLPGTTQMRVARASVTDKGAVTEIPDDFVDVMENGEPLGIKRTEAIERIIMSLEQRMAS